MPINTLLNFQANRSIFFGKIELFLKVRVGIDYCAINNFDVKCIYKDVNTVTLPFIPGSEFSGEILEVGPKCTSKFQKGDKVAVLGETTLK